MGLSSPGGSPYRARVIADGASHYWRLGETTGTTAADEIGGSAPGTISGGVTLGQPGALSDGNRAMAFDGTTGKIVINAHTVPVVQTTEFWLKLTASGYHAAVSARTVGTGSAFTVFTNTRPEIYGELPSAQYVDPTPLNDGAWHHFVFVTDGVNATLFLDGLSKGAQAFSRLTPNVGPLVMGHDTESGAYFWLGSLQDVAIYPRALTAPEIAAHYALRTAVATTPITQAYTWARSGIARSDATRSNYVLAWSVDLIVRDGAGNITSQTDITLYIRHGSLQVTQALNDEADTCSFQIVPTAPHSAVPQVGQEIAVSWTPGDVLFRGYALVVQFDRRPMNESPWVSVQCQDAMWRFDARIVTYRFPAQSVTASIAFLIQWFCNDLDDPPSPNDFQTTFVQANMPTIDAFDVVNQRPSTVMRRLMTAVQGAFYIDGRDVHAWAGSLSEPNQANPQPLTNELATLKTFRVTHDATQVRRRVLVEGRRTDTLIGSPAAPADKTGPMGLPLSDATLFDTALGPAYKHLVRIGTQWAFMASPTSVTALGAQPPQTQVAVAFDPAAGSDTLHLKPMAVMPPAYGWIRVGNQYSRYADFTGNPLTETWQLNLAGAIYPYGRFTVVLPVNETVEWVDNVLSVAGWSLNWNDPVIPPAIGYPMRASPVDTPVVTLAVVSRPYGTWPPLEGFVQDGRYSYAGARARAEADLDLYADPLINADWETEDLNAQPGRLQAINLTGSSVIDPLTLTMTITTVDITFPLRTELPRRRCVGGTLKPSTFVDLVLLDTT